MKFYIVFGVLAALALHAIAEETKESSAAAVVASASTPPVTKATVLGEKFSLIPSSYGAALATGGAVVVGVVVLLAIAAVISPLFGLKLCQIFSTCDAANGGAYVGDAYSAGYASSPYVSTYQKRSIEYVGPILQALNSAYEKYGHGAGSASVHNVKKINAQ